MTFSYISYKNIGGLYMFLIFALLLIVVLIIWVISIYNQFIKAGERVLNAKAQIATQIESRWDGITTLLKATKNYEKHEVETLEKVTEKRIGESKESSVKQIEDEENQYHSEYERLKDNSKNYPELKAREVYRTTMTRIDKYENKVRHARMIYNDVVMKFNRLVRLFPSNFVAKMFHFEEK